MKEKVMGTHENNGNHARGSFTSGRKMAWQTNKATKTPGAREIAAVDWKKNLQIHGAGAKSQKGLRGSRAESQM